MLARQTWAVQMLLVALSRRMCCSRVCMAMRSAGRPDASRLTPTSSLQAATCQHMCSSFATEGGQPCKLEPQVR